MDAIRRLGRAVTAAVMSLAVASCGGAVTRSSNAPGEFADALNAANRSPEISAAEDTYAPLLGVWEVEARDRTEDESYQVS